MPIPSTRIVVGFACLFAVAAGCQLFDRVRKTAGPPSDKNPLLKELAVANETIQLEIIIVERPLFEKAVSTESWKSLDQMAAISVAERARLARHGMRIGVSPDPPSQGLQKLLSQARMPFKTTPGSVKLAGAQVSANGIADRRGISQTIPLRNGDSTEIQTSPVYESCTMIPPAADGSPGKANTYRNCRSVLRVKAEKVQDGWVRLTILPEVHHGDSKLRRISRGGDWKLKTGQEIVPLYPLQCKVSLNLSELAVIGMMSPTDTPPGSPGMRFFGDASPTPQTQRLVVIKLVGMKKAEQIFNDATPGTKPR